MSWWNPVTWGGDAAVDLAKGFLEGIEGALKGIKTKVAEDPMIVLAPLGALTAAITVYNAARSGGRELGTKIAQQLTEGEYDGQ